MHPPPSLEQLDLFALKAEQLPPKPVLNLEGSIGRGPRHEPQGSVYDLQKFFDIINESVFKNLIDPCILRWSRNRWYQTLGLCDVKKRVITMNTALDDARVPDVVVAHVVHHEMLHLYYGISEGRNGRRAIHTPQFRTAEKIFPGYDPAVKWLEQNWPLRGRPAKARSAEQSFLTYLTMMST